MNDYHIGILDICWLLAGLGILSRWLKQTRWGTLAFNDTPLNSTGTRIRSLVGLTGRWKACFKSVPIYCLTFFGLTIGVLSVTVALYGVWGLPVERHSTLNQITQSNDWKQIVTLCISAGIIAPVAEEFLFRGIVQNGLIVFLSFLSSRPSSDLLPLENSSVARATSSWPRWLGIVLTAMFFASCHEIHQHWPALFVLALGLGYSYEKQGNLIVPVMIHGLFNSFSLTMNLLFPPNS